MNANNYGKLGGGVFFALLIYCAAAEGISLFVIGMQPMFFVGLLIGAAVVVLNFYLLIRAVFRFQSNGKREMRPIVVTYLGRLGIYAIGAVLCYLLAHWSLIGYAAGILGILVCAFMSLHYIRGDENEF